MKKIFSLIVAGFCWMGSIRGQAIELEVAVVQCDVSEGTLIISVKNAPSYSYPVKVSVSRIGMTLQSGYIDDEDSPFEMIIQQSPFMYTVSVPDLGLVKNDIKIDATFKPVNFNGFPDLKVDCPYDLKINPAMGKIKVNAMGDNLPFNYILLENGAIIDESGAIYKNEHTFSNLSRDKSKKYEVYIEDANGCRTTAVEGVTKNIFFPDYLPLKVNQNVDNVTCDGKDDGSVSFTITEGTAIGEYNGINYPIYELDEGWISNTDGIFNGLKDDSYCVTIYDAESCYIIENFEIEVAAPILLESQAITSKSVTCADQDGKIKLTVNVKSKESGWDLEYYTKLSDDTDWGLPQSSPEITVPILGAGSHDMDIMVKYADDESSEYCSGKILQHTMVIPDPITFIIQSTPPTCNQPGNGMIKVTDESGGHTGTDFYFGIDNGKGIEWQDGSDFTGLAPSTYTIYVKQEVDDIVCLAPQQSHHTVRFDTLDDIEIDNTIVVQPCDGQSNGKITIKAKGGSTNPDYIYELFGWLPGPSWVFIDRNETGIFDGLPAGEYYVQIFNADESCSTEKIFVVSLEEVKPLTATIDPMDEAYVTHILCFGEKTGRAKVKVEGGREPYSFEWTSENWELGEKKTTQEITNLNAGIYTVKVADGCNATPVEVSVPVIQPDELDIKILSEGYNACGENPGGYLKIQASGGKLPYAYTVNGNPYEPDENGVLEIFGLKTDYEHWIVVSDANECLHLEKVTIKDEQLTISIEKAEVLCYNEDGEITLTVSGGTPEYTIKVFDDINTNPIKTETISGGKSIITISMDGVTAGTTKTYSVTVEDTGGCTVTTTTPIHLKKPNELKATLALNGSICNLPVRLERGIFEGQGSISTEWYRNDNLMDQEFQNEGSIDTSLPGEYYVVIKDDHCDAKSNVIEIILYEPLDFDRYEAYGVDCPDDFKGAIRIFKPTGGFGGDEFIYQVFQVFDGDENPISVEGITWERNSEGDDLISGLPQGQYYIEMKHSEVGVDCIPMLRIPEQENEYITIGRNIRFEGEVKVFLPCESGSTTEKTYIEFVVSWSGKGEFPDVTVECGGRIYENLIGNSLVDGKWKFTLDLETSGEAVIIIGKDSDCPVTKTVVIPESLSFSCVPDKECVSETDVTLIIMGAVAPYKVWFGNDEYNNDDSEDNRLRIFNVVAGTPYHVTVVDSRCSKSDLFLLSPPVDIDVINEESGIGNASCNDAKDGYIVLPNTYNYHYFWEKDGSEGFEMNELAAGKYRVTISNYDGKCPVDHEIQIGIAYEVDVEIFGNGGGDNNNSFCPGGDVKLTGVVKINGEVVTDVEYYNEFKGYWQFSSNNDLPAYYPNAQLEFEASSQMIQLTASFEPSNGVVCGSSKSFGIIELPLPKVAFEDEVIYIAEGMQEELKVIAEGWDDYQWVSDPPGFDNLGDPKFPPIMLTSTPTDYKLTLTLTEGVNNCSASASIDVGYLLNLFIPNAFTPNGDGNHEVWEFRNMDQYTFQYDIQVVVFTRTGTEIFSCNSYNVGLEWDGRRNVQDVPIGTYYYIVRIVHKTTRVLYGKPITGWVTIIR